MPVKVNISPAKVEAKVNTAWKRGLGILSEEILADCNEYCKRDEGYLIESSLTHSRPQKGKLIWQTPYARRQYWEIETSLEEGRTWKWCETAKEKHFEKWKQKAQEHFEDNL